MHEICKQIADENCMQTSKMLTLTQQQVSTGVKILNDEDAKKIQKEELILFMGSFIYKNVCHQLRLRPRTLLNQLSLEEKLVKDDSVMIQLRYDCKVCNAQMLEPKLKKAL